MEETKPEQKVPEQDSETKETKPEQTPESESEKTTEAQESEETQEMKEVEILEFGLSEEEIDELIEKLNHLKQLKTEISFEVDEENEFLIKYLSAGGPVDTKTDLSDIGMRG